MAEHDGKDPGESKGLRPTAPFVGWVGSFGLATGLLLVVNLVLLRIDLAWARWLLCSAVLAVFVGVRPLRRVLAKAIAVTLLLATLGFVVRSHGSIGHGRLQVGDVVLGILREARDIGPGKQLRGLLRARSDARRSLLTPSVVEPGRDVVGPARPSPVTTTLYDRYLGAVDHRSPQINGVAARITRGCATGDHLCESSHLVRFVTDEVEYRSDPRGAGDYVKPPLQTLESRAGDCEDKTILLVSLVESVGIRTVMVFQPHHTFPMVCFENTLPEMFRASAAVATRRGLDLQGYLAAPWDTFRLERHVATAARFGVGRRDCYAVETTDPGSWIGSPGNPTYDLAFDPIERKTVTVWPPLGRLYE